MAAEVIRNGVADQHSLFLRIFSGFEYPKDADKLLRDGSEGADHDTKSELRMARPRGLRSLTGIAGPVRRIDVTWKYPKPGGE